MIDISPLISPKIAVWTGDTPFSQEFLCRFDTGANLDLSTITTTVHLGAHTDAPSHYHPTGETMESRSQKYYGQCRSSRLMCQGESGFYQYIWTALNAAERISFIRSPFQTQSLQHRFQCALARNGRLLCWAWCTVDWFGYTVSGLYSSKP